MEPLSIDAALEELKNLLDEMEKAPHNYTECNRRQKRITELCDYLDKMDKKGDK